MHRSINRCKFKIFVPSVSLTPSQKVVYFQVPPACWWQAKCHSRWLCLCSHIPVAHSQGKRTAHACPQANICLLTTVIAELRARPEDCFLHGHFELFGFSSPHPSLQLKAGHSLLHNRKTHYLLCQIQSFPKEKVSHCPEQSETTGTIKHFSSFLYKCRNIEVLALRRSIPKHNGKSVFLCCFFFRQS